MSWLGKLFRPGGAEVSPDAMQSRQDAPQRAADTSPRGEAGKRPETARKSRSALDEANAFLLEVLALAPRPTKEVQSEAKARGIAWATLRRAMPKAGVKKRKAGFQGRWMLEIQTCSGASKDAQDFGVSIFAKVACERPAEEAKRSDQDLSEAPLTPPRPDPDAGLVPPGFTIPPGAECVSWALKPAPLKLDRGVTVLNVDDLVKGHLEILAAKLRGDKGWLFEQWPLTTLLADLSDVGVELRTPVDVNSLTDEEKS